MFGAKLLTQCLRPVYGQAIVRAVPWVKADDIVVAFHIFPPLVFPIAEICPHTGNGKILPTTVQRGQPVSYTHLDVYKRQGFFSSDATLARTEASYASSTRCATA